MNIELSKEHEKALQAFEDNSKKVVFLTGNAGTGKSTLIKHFLQTTQQRCVILAPTAIAAQNVKGATIHSFFHLKHSPNLCEEYKSLSKINTKTFSCFDTIIIDEISMVRADIFWALSYLLEERNGKPFGGKKLIIVGDMCQLPPVTKGETEKARLVEDLGGVYWFYGSPHNVAITKVELTKVFRQKDNLFIEVLNELRKEKPDFNTILPILNARVTNTVNEKSIVLSPTNAIADAINHAKLNEINSTPYTFEAEIEGNYKETDAPVPSYIVLKKGARIVFCVNTADFKNGETGTIEELNDDTIQVIKDNGDLVGVTPHMFTKRAYSTDLSLNEGKLESKLVIKEVGSFTQMPLKLAYAITIHKSQGQTFSNVHIQNDKPMFAHGQGYVALSRCETLEGLSLSKPLNARDFIFDKKAFI